LAASPSCWSLLREHRAGVLGLLRGPALLGELGLGRAVGQDRRDELVHLVAALLELRVHPRQHGVVHALELAHGAEHDLPPLGVVVAERAHPAHGGARLGGLEARRRDAEVGLGVDHLGRRREHRQVVLGVVVVAHGERGGLDRPQPLGRL
jgi:hypothetical protein